jgi:uncharacterized protein YndB with AHSA1/START domain
VTRFSAGTRAEAVVDASRERVWAALTDPDVVAALTPFVRRIVPVVSGPAERWRWEMTGLSVLGVGIAPTFTERMTYDEPARIDFRHDPPPERPERPERSAVEGWYRLEDVVGGTRLTTAMEITLDLPLPRAASGAVRAAMGRVIDQMGERFARNLLAHLGAHEVG